jgi:cytochrome c peroxidase
MLKHLFIITFFYNILAANEPISPLPVSVKYDKEKALLGKKLFFDTILSKDNKVSCNSCHLLSKGGADGNRVSIGFAGKKGNIQAPTVYNARYNFKQFWNGRADDLTEQANGPITNPNEHNMNPKLIEKRVNASKEYKKLFSQIYHKNYIHYDDVIDAIVEFEKALVTPNAKFDRYLRGEVTLSKDEREGYILFKEYGCITCHNGINIGGNSFQKMGTFFPYESNATFPDRAVLKHNAHYKNVFKVPTLRNIALTAPYFHDGSAKTLQEAVTKMSYHNLGVDITSEDAQKIVSFLRTLSGEKPEIANR